MIFPVSFRQSALCGAAGLLLFLTSGCQLPTNHSRSKSIAKPSSFVNADLKDELPAQPSMETSSTVPRKGRIVQRLKRWTGKALQLAGHAVAIVTVGVMEDVLGEWLGMDVGDSEYDRLWKQGYGYNNPNDGRPDRRGRL